MAFTDLHEGVLELFAERSRSVDDFLYAEGLLSLRAHKAAESRRDWDRANPEKMRASQRKYKSSPVGKATQKRYSASAKGKAAQKRYYERHKEEKQAKDRERRSNMTEGQRQARRERQAAWFRQRMQDPAYAEKRKAQVKAARRKAAVRP